MLRKKKMAESALQLFSRLGMKEQIGNLDLPFFSSLSSEGQGLKAGDVIEFCGTEGTGKSEILLNIAARCVLPKVWQGEKLGKETEIVYISTDYKFDLQRLGNLIESHLTKDHNAALSQGGTDYKETVMSCLTRVHVVYSKSSTELSMSLQYLKTFLHNHSRVCVLMLDNVAAYYWMDKDKTEHHWITSMRELVQDYHLVVIATKPLLFHQRESRSMHTEIKVDKTSPVNDFMPKPWQKMVKYRFHLDRTSVSGQTVYTANQYIPSGQVFRFHICDKGLVFL